MAALIPRLVRNGNVFSLAKRTICITASKRADKMMPDPLEHATGLEKKELLAHLAGNEDPFDMLVMKRGPGTKDSPNIVKSCENKRIIGCICEEESTTVNWMWLHMGEPKRCECGYWFKLVEGKPL